MRYNLRKKVLLLTTLSVVVVGTTLSYMFVTTMNQREEQNIASCRATLLGERRQALKGHIELAVSALEKLPPDEAKKIAATMEFGEEGSLWINDFSGAMLANPSPSFGGKSRLDLMGPDGGGILREITRICREKGEADLSYVWNRPGRDAMPVPMFYYAKAMTSRSWIVGACIYSGDIDVEVAKELSTTGQAVPASITKYLTVTFAILGCLLIAAVLLVSKFIFRPIETITGTLRDFNNDLTVTIPVMTSDEVGELARWLNEHIKRLNRIIGKVSIITEEVNSHAGAIALTMEQQSAFAIQLSSSVVEISSTMEEFSSTARQIAQHSQSVVERADRTLEDSKHGATEVENLTFKINDISENIQENLGEIVELGKKSKEINKIMTIINNIANQTKLIAFNAAIEAASAGEEGKRFGVVAVEIRRLADSVVESTSEIEGKITEILDSVHRLVMSSEKSFQLIQEGQEYASHTVSMLIESVDGVDETASAARQISLSTQQQQIASSQVVLALKDIEHGVRHATESIHQSTIVTGELAELSEQLRSLIMTFKVRKEADEGAT